MIKKYIKLNLVVWTIIFTVVTIISIHFNIELSKNVPSIVEYKKINNDGISFNEFNKIKEDLNGLTATSYSENKCIVKNKYDVFCSKDIKTKVVLTDANFFHLYSHKFVVGGNFDIESVDKGNKVAIISDKIAIDMYKSIDVVGNIIKINGDNFQIIGVYKNNDSFSYNMAGDGYERIMIPYSSYKLTKENKDSIIDIFATNETEFNTVEVINNKLKEILGSKLGNYNKINYILLKNISYQYTRIVIFLVGLCVIGVLVRLILKHFKFLKLFFKEKLRNDYILQILKDNKKNVIIFTAKILGFILLIFIVFKLISFNIVVDNSYLPADNIFDLEFYRNAILKDIQRINANEAGFSNICDRYLMRISNIQKVLLVGGIVSLALIIINLKQNLKGNSKGNVPKEDYK